MKTILSIIVTMAFVFTINTASAVPLLPISLFANLLSIDTDEACDFGPVREAIHVSNNFSSKVSACEYEANKAEYTIVK